MTDQHISHIELVAAADGELSTSRAAQVREHLAACWTCRTHAKEIEDSIAEFVHAHQDACIAPSVEAPRAMLKARLAELAQQRPLSWRERFGEYSRVAAFVCAAAGLAAIYFTVGAPARQSPFVPDPKLTPGATLTISASEVCQMPSNVTRMIPASVGQEVFDQYGIQRPRPRDYELDYLIAPELGGADDPRNYWPQPYGNSEWNAHVKDALEDRLHELVCENKLSLATAQRDISSNWIQAYKKYFQTQEPIASHRAFTKDAPWEP